MEELSSSAITAREWCWWVLFRLSLSTPMWSSSSAYSKDSITSALDLFLNLLYFAVESVGLLITGLIFWCFPGGHAWGRYCWKIRSSSTIPGSNGLPFVGSIGLMSGLAHRHLAKEARRLKAERLMAFSVGECRVVITSHPDVAKEILNSSAFVNRKAKESAYKLMFHRSIGFAPYGVYWRTLRKIAEGHLFSLKQITAWQPVRSEIASEMASEIRKMNKNNKEVRVRDVLKPAALNNIMWMVFGRRYVIGSNEKKQELEELHELLQEGYELLGKVDWADHLPILSSFDLQGIRSRCNALVPKINHFVNRIVREQRQKSGEKDGNIQSFIDVLFSLQNREKNLSDSDINAILWEMVFRGADAVGVLMEWAMARMVLHPDIQEKAQEELDRVVGRSRAVAGRDMKELVYIQAVVKETLRLHPPGPLLSWSRLSTCDTTVDGHHVPAGTTGMVNMWAISQDGQVWDEPMLFRPERFLHGVGGEREIISIMGSDLRLAPFGSGRRSCPGKTLGISSVEFWIASLLHEYKWSPAASVDLSEDLRLTCEMKNPLLVNVRPRPRN